MFQYSIFFIITFSLINTGASETTIVGKKSSSAKTTQCTALQIKSNKELLNKCKKSWKKWGVNPPPPKKELRDPYKCISNLSTKAMINSTGACAEAIAALPLLIGELALKGVLSLRGVNKNSKKYIFEKGNQKQIFGYLEKELMRKHCKIALGEGKEYITKMCNQMKKRNCNPFIKEVKVAKKCIRSPKFKKIYRSLKAQLNGQATEVIKKRLMAKKKLKKKRELRDSAMASIRKKCDSLIYIRSSSFLRPPVRIDFNKKSVKKYNKCVNTHPKATPELIKSLTSLGAGIIDKVLGEYESLDCYNDHIRRKFYCDVALTAVGLGGVAKLGVYSAKKLGDKTARKMKDVAKNTTDSIINLKVKAGLLSNQTLNFIKSKKLPKVTLKKLQRALDSLSPQELKYLNKNSSQVLGNIKACPI